jgi:hypothetical protein
MKSSILMFIIILLLGIGCDKESTEPEPALNSQISVTGDVTESYKVTALFGTSTYTSDIEEKEYFSIILFPNEEGSNPLAFTILYKSGSGQPSTQSYTIGEYAMGEDIPAGHFGGGFSGINTEGFGGYTMNQGTISFKSVSESRISGDLNMGGYWRLGVEEDSSRTVSIEGTFNAAQMPEE